MTLAKKDYDAQAAEEAMNRYVAFLQEHGAPTDDNALSSLTAVAVYAQIAQAHALESLATQVSYLTDVLERIESSGLTINLGRTAS